MSEQRRSRKRGPRARYGYYLRSVWSLLAGFSHPLRILRVFSPLPRSGVTTVRLRRTGVSFRVRGATDVWSVKETWLDRFYERYGFVIGPGWVVVDIGAGIGEFTILAAHDAARVVAFEPSPASFALLRENLALNGVTSVDAIEAAVGATSGTVSIDVDGDPLTARSGTATSGGVMVRSFSLADAMTEAGIERVDLLKLDCEGAEYDILRGAGKDVLARVERIVMEYHDLDDAHERESLVRSLKDAGYEVETFPNPVHTWTGYLRAWRA